MTSISALENVYEKGLFGDYEDKNENKLIKIQERKNLLIVQIVQYKNSSSSTKDIKIDGLNLLGPCDTNNQAGVISFDISSIHPHDIGTFLDQRGIAIRTGHHCSMPLMNRLNLPATARASFYIYNTFEEVDKLVDAIIGALEFFGK